MDPERVQKRKDRKGDRARKKAEKKAVRAAAADDEEPGTKTAANRVSRLMRTAEADLAAARTKLVARESAFGPEALGAARALLTALDGLLDLGDPAAPFAVVEARTVLEAALADARARGAGAGVLGGAPPRRLPAVPGAPVLEAPAAAQPAPARPAPARPAQALPAQTAPSSPPPAMPSYMQAPARSQAHGAPPGRVQAPAAVPAPAPVAHAPPAMVGSALEDDDLTSPATVDAPETPAQRPQPVQPVKHATMNLTADAARMGAKPSAGALPFTPTGTRADADPLRRFPLPTYAAVCAELQAHPHIAPAILARYGLTDPGLRDAVDRGHKEKIAKDPAVRAQFDDLYARALAALRPPP